MRIAYTLQQKAEAIALAAIVGAEAAAEQLGMDARSVRKWSGQAGRAPELAAKPDQWQRLHDLAIAKVTNDLVSGKTRPRDTAVIAAIAKRNLSRPEPLAQPQTLPEDWGDQLHDRLAALGYDAHGYQLALIALLHRDGDQPDGSYRVLGDEDAWQEAQDEYRELSPEQRQIALAEIAASVEQHVAYVVSLGDLDVWREQDSAMHSRHHAEQIERNRAAAAAFQQGMLADEDRALLAAAEAFLARTA